MTLHQLTFSAWLLLAMQSLTAQGLLSLNEGVEGPTVPVSATFKDTRIVNVQSNETPAEGVLHFVITDWDLELRHLRFVGLGQRPNENGPRLRHHRSAGYRHGAQHLPENARSQRQSALVATKYGAEAIPISVTWYSVAMANGLRVRRKTSPTPFLDD